MGISWEAKILESVGILGQKLSEKRKKKKAEEGEKSKGRWRKRGRWPPLPLLPILDAAMNLEKPLLAETYHLLTEKEHPPGTERKSTPARSEPKTHHPAPSRTDAPQLAAAPRKDKTPARGKESEDSNVKAMSDLNLSGNSSKEPVSNKAGKAPESNAPGRGSSASQVPQLNPGSPKCYKVIPDVHYKFSKFANNYKDRSLHGVGRLCANF
ncbi:uncharacterized protein EAF02_006843 [Botrytis sinoallii]|uniref:uncharacterized protein n=1 Tax=Botrytis sinoallii TaxID=1463999 RepID=UPI001900AFBE|nr:uncharacterized protein EAF02_006843 [Botrytis sinoallii]KAF7880952.1 hypothetical protein EAF02_006843 [Botrytis sinoallii]